MATVLIVDDDKFTRSVLQTALAHDPALEDLQLITAAHGKEGLEAFADACPEVVITDLLMPEVDGFSLCRAIREHARGKGVHLIVMSGIYRGARVVQQLQDEFGATFFAKPYQLRELARHVVALIEQGHRGDGAPAAAPPRSPLAFQVSSGDLSRRPLPAVLLDFLEARASGRLTLRRGRISKVVELVFGHPLSVSSTSRDEALGHFLVAFGAITDEQHKRAVQRAAQTRERVSDALIALGILTPEDMVARLTMQTCYKLMQSLRWPDGVWRFQPEVEQTSGPRGNPIDMVALILQGLRQSASQDSMAERVAELEGRALRLTPRGRALLPAMRQFLSARLADVWADGISTATLLRAGVERSELSIALEALQLCAAIEVAEPGQSDGVVVASPGADAGDYSVEELSELSHTRRLLRPTADSTGELYAALFDDAALAPLTSAGDVPIELPDEELEVIDSGIIDVAALQRRVEGAPSAEEENFARRLLLKEYLRIQAMDHYDVVRIDRDAPRDRIASALSERRARLSMDWFARFELGRDYAKLEEVHAAYDRAAEVLLSDEARAAYDRGLAVDLEVEPSEPALDAEIAYHAGQDLLQHGSYEGAIEHLQAAVAAAPDEADYHAALGWALYLKGECTPHAADEARPHLNQGLAINPDHAPSHGYKGMISAALGADLDEAIFHLERALDADPSRGEVLRTLERILSQRGELRPLERQYRRMIYRIAGADPALELSLWLQLGELYRSQLGELDNARIAYESAARLAPDDPRIQAALAHLGAGAADLFLQRAERLRRAWRKEPLAPVQGLLLMRAATEAGRPDAAFMAASALVARGCADADAEAMYQRYRPRFVIRAQRPLEPELWQSLRHPQDRAELEIVFAILAPALDAAFPLDTAELEIDESAAVGEDDLPEPFVRVRAYVAQMLGVPIPRVFVRPDFGHQVHVGAVSPPVLLAGDELLTSPERSELAFRLGRAMTFLLPGRTFASSRPARLLRAAVLALAATGDAGGAPPDPEGHVAAIRASMDLVDPLLLRRARRIIAELTSASPALNLSLWARALARTAERVGLLLCGDLPAAVRFARDSSNPRVVDDLIDFALSSECWSLRAQLGLSIDV